MIDILILIIGLILSSYTDIKTKEVPDYLSGILIGIGFISFLLNLKLNLTYLLSPVLGASIGYLFYRLSQWGGADFKILLAVSLFLRNNFIYFLLNFLIGALIYTTISMIKITNKKREMLIIAIISFLILLINPSMSFFTLTFSVILITAKEIENKMIFEIPTKNLTEGDWVIEKIKGVYTPNYKGVTKEEIKKIRKVKKIVKIKSGIPFVPSFLLSLIITILNKYAFFNLIYGLGILGFK